MKNEKLLSPAHKKFVNERDDWNEKQIQLSQLYYLTLLEKASERNRSNTSTLVWIVAIMIILSIVGLLMGSM